MGIDFLGAIWLSSLLRQLLLLEGSLTTLTLTHTFKQGAAQKSPCSFLSAPGGTFDGIGHWILYGFVSSILISFCNLTWEKGLYHFPPPERRSDPIMMLPLEGSEFTKPRHGKISPDPI